MNNFRYSVVAFSILYVFTTSSCACVCPGEICNDGTTSSKVTSTAEEIAVGGTSDSGTAGLLKSIHFDYKQAKPLESDLAQLRSNVDWMKSHASVRLIVEGHGDRIGSNKYNTELSRDRAQTVMKMLIDAGVDRARLRIRSMGQLAPISNTSSHAESEISLDRRVNFIIESLSLE